ncbi:DUF4833 domain-containing protein [Stappia sp. F7233]|uniref:DUF4833 domain-containing protein n=1 Tax=Stappia albiluteola TaxID=2758565 RepID=A0A839AGB2_9HYPH|nr:DUF4833 domain-containing protein [Stappia albiluteola]MBA5778743.1 DUF4833 domain-containing protein [Stappia albiluteola]
MPCGSTIFTSLMNAGGGKSFRPPTFAPGSLIAAALLAISLAAADPAAAAGVRALPSTVEVHGTLPTVRPEYPVPNDPDQLFFLQRSTNSNTVVYKARFLPDGRLDPARPIEAYWRRFNTSGEKKALGFLENRFAFGVRTQPVPGQDAYEVRFVAFPDRKALLVQQEPGKATITFKAGQRELALAYGYVDVDQSGVIDEVVQVRVFGHDKATGQPVSEIVPVSGGKIGLGGG